MVDACSKCMFFISRFSARTFSQLWQSQDVEEEEDPVPVDALSEFELVSDCNLFDFDMSELEFEVSETVEMVSADFDIWKIILKSSFDIQPNRKINCYLFVPKNNWIQNSQTGDQWPIL